MMNKTTQQCGYIAIIGRPNVGKSTLLNKILGQKISITSRKPQTTRHQILGINTDEQCQMLFVDTPGIHKAQGKALNRAMNKNALSVIYGVDVVIFMVEALKWKDEDQWILDKLTDVDCPVILVINKTDQIKQKKEMLPFVEGLSEKFTFETIVMLSAKSGDNVTTLQQQIKQLLPEHEFVFTDDEITDRSTRFITAEIIREKIFRLTGQELPYSTAVEVEQYEQKDKVTHISAVILVDKASQKPILIGKGGEKLKTIGTQARTEIEKLIGNKVYLRLWIKIKGGWADDDRALRSLGYSD